MEVANETFFKEIDYVEQIKQLKMDVPPYYRNGYKMMAITHLMEDLEDIEN